MNDRPFTADDAIAVLKENDRGSYNVPTKGLYPFQWNWDSCFTALGQSHFDLPRAWTEIEWFIRKGRRWERRHERVEEICWSNAEMRQGLREAGFTSVVTRDAAPFFDDQHTRPGYRTFWRARKR